MTGQLTLGVIGHVDHGKTALVRALTGIETDRLREEQERGLSIVLGFSYLDSSSGVLDLIDVPGHEDFIRTMISGATGIDGVLVIIAANEGIMPQTREHFDIAQLLGIEQGLIVITKVDLVSTDELDAVKESIRAYVKGSFLEGATMVETSALKQQGLDSLRSALKSMSEAAVPRESGDQFFLPVDRVFAISGFGSVVTGTLRGGNLRANEKLEILPWGGTASVRGLQVRNEATELAPPGQRVAVNLRGLKKGEVKRGDTLASPGFLKTTRRIDAEVQLLDSQKHALKNGIAVRLLLGTTEVLAKVRLLDQKQLEPGATGLVQLRCQRDISTHRTEHFILRSYSPAQTIGGGRILDLDPPRHKRLDKVVIERLRSTAEGNAAEMVESSLAAVGVAGIETEVLREKLGLVEADMAAAISALDAVVIDQRRLVARSSHSQLVGEILSAVERYHEANRRHRGVAAGSLKSRLSSAPHAAVFHHAVDQLVASGQLQADNGILRSGGFDPLATLSDSERNVAAEIEEIFRSGGLAPPPVETVLQLGADHRSLFKLLVEVGQIVPLKTYDRNSKMALHRDTLRDIEQLLQTNYLYPKDFTISQVRDLLAATRKYVVPLMEHLDATGVTIRTGNVRRLREH